MDIKSLKRDVAASTEGAWVGEIPEMGDLRLRVRGWNSPIVSNLHSQKTLAVPRDKRRMNGAPIPSETARIVSEVLHEVVLLDWDGLTNDGKPVKFNADLALKWLTDPDYHEFADAVFLASQVVAKGNAQRTDDIAGN
jgi:hypothetical protein